MGSPGKASTAKSTDLKASSVKSTEEKASSVKTSTSDGSSLKTLKHRSMNQAITKALRHKMIDDCLTNVIASTNQKKSVLEPKTPAFKNFDSLKKKIVENKLKTQINSKSKTN